MASFNVSILFKTPPEINVNALSEEEIRRKVDEAIKEKIDSTISESEKNQ